MCIIETNAEQRTTNSQNQKGVDYIGSFFVFGLIGSVQGSVRFQNTIYNPNCHP